MRLDERIGTYLHKQHSALRAAIPVADAAIAALRPRPAATPPPQIRRPGPPTPRAPAESPLAPPSQPKLLPHLAVQDAWEALRRPLLAHLDLEDRTLAVALRVLGGDTGLRGPVLAVIRQFENEHADLRRLGGQLRAVAMLHDEAKRPVVDLLDCYDEATRVQDIEIYPALLAGSELAFQLGQTPVPVHYARSDDVLKQIRGRRPTPDPKLESAPGLVDRLRKLIGR